MIFGLLEKRNYNMLIGIIIGAVVTIIVCVALFIIFINKIRIL